MTVEVWLIATTPSEAELAAHEHLLDATERARAAGAGTPDARRRYVSAHGAVRTLLGVRLGVDPAALAFAAGVNGKPALVGFDVHVNMSRSGDWAMLALSVDRPVGVDVQRLQPSMDVSGMARRWFAAAEAAEVASAGPTAAEVFGRLWARKEAVVKAAGGRILLSSRIEVAPPVVDFPDEPAPGRYRVRDLDTPAGYRAAVAVAGSDEVTVTTHPPA